MKEHPACESWMLYFFILSKQCRQLKEIMVQDKRVFFEILNLAEKIAG